MRSTRRLLGVAVAGSIAMSLLAAAPAGAAGGAKATLNVVHGIPGVDVNVCVNGAEAISDFNPGEVVKGVKLPPGSYDLKVVAASDDCADPAVLEADGIRLKEGRNYTAVAHLKANGAPTIGLFRNDVSEVGEGRARLIVRHTAAAPAVDLWANGAILGEGLNNGETFTAVLPAGVYAAWVSLPGDYRPVIGPDVLKVRRGHTYQVYAWGNGTDGYDLAVVPARSGVK